MGTLSSTIGALGKLPGISAPSALKQSLIDRIRRESYSLLWRSRSSGY